MFLDHGYERIRYDGKDRLIWFAFAVFAVVCEISYHEHLDRDKANLGHTNRGKYEAVVRCKDLGGEAVTLEGLSAPLALQSEIISRANIRAYSMI